jgi:hypothetical protein
MTLAATLVCMNCGKRNCLPVSAPGVPHLTTSTTASA